MKQEKITIAYKMLEKINRVPGLPFSVCSKLFMAKKSLAPYIEAQAEKENIIFENAGVDKVIENEVDNAVSSTKVDSGFCTVAGEGLQAAPLTACHDHAKDILLVFS